MLFLGLLLAGWFLIRVVTWQDPWPALAPLPETLRFASSGVLAPESVRPLTEPAAGVSRHDRAARPKIGVFAPGDSPRTPGMPALTASRPDTTALFDSRRYALGHSLLFAAGMARLPLPMSVATLLDRENGAMRSMGSSDVPASPSPWRFDGWVALRQGGTGLSNGGQRPASYGASQMGAVLAYHLAPHSAHSPVAYGRASRALIDGGETEGALGLRVHPFPGVPVSLHGEARLFKRAGRAAEIRPAAFVAGGFDSLDLPAGVKARAYGQAGYVGGDFDTAFADGAIVAERRIARFDLGEISLGAGAWGGAQRGAARLDLGPRLAVRLDRGPVAARIEADYRWRVAGQAVPGSGGVLTLSTGF